MKRNWLWAVGLVLVLAVVGLAGCSEDNTTPIEIQGVNWSSQQSGIWVSGQGEVTATPDIAILRLGIEAQEATMAQAQTQAAEAMSKVMTALKNNGIAEKDIQTQQFSINKITRWDDKNQQEVVIGYRVTNIVSAKIRDIDKAGSVIDAVAAAGGGLTRIDSITFSIDDPSSYYSDARDEAMADAEAKAKQLATLAVVTLGKPTYISESIYIPFPIRGAGEAVAPAPDMTSISPGEMQISISVQVTYAIVQ